MDDTAAPQKWSQSVLITTWWLAAVLVIDPTFSSLMDHGPKQKSNSVSLRGSILPRLHLNCPTSKAPSNAANKCVPHQMNKGCNGCIKLSQASLGFSDKMFFIKVMAPRRPMLEYHVSNQQVQQQVHVLKHRGTLTLSHHVQLQLCC